MALHLWLAALMGMLVGFSSCSQSEEGRSKTKRSFSDVFLHNDLDLFHAGMMLAEHYHPALAPFYQSNDLVQPFEQEQRNVHQYQHDIPTSAPRNPKRPVYHFTPLPKGTFPETKPVDEHERIKSTQEDSSTFVENPSYLFSYRVNDADHGLLMGQQEKMEDNVLQGVYHVLLPDSRIQIVQYLADYSGYHPTITYA